MPKDGPRCNKCYCSGLIFHYVSFALLYVPLGVAWYWGDLYVYLTSYWYMSLGYSSLPTPWLLSIYIATWSTAFILTSFLIKKIDQRIATTVGVLLFDVGIFSSYFSVQHSVSAINFTMGFLAGSGFGVIQAEVYARIAKLVTGKIGIVFATVNNCYNVGAVCFNAVITWYINADNLEADLWFGRTKVFNNKSVIDRVPSVFIILGVITSSCHIPGLVISLIINNGEEQSNSDKNSSPERSTTNISDGLKETISSSISETEYKSYRIVKETPSMGTKQISINNSPKNCNDVTEKNQKDESGTAPAKSIISEPTSSCSNTMDLGPWEALKTFRFYIVWFTIFATDASYIVLFNFYKVFGELWIRDDHFVTNLAMIAIATVFITRFLWGVLIDKLTVRTAQVIFTAALSLAFSLYFFTPQLNRWIFAVWTIGTVTLTSAVYLNLPVVTLKLFGRNHFGVNYGLVGTSTIVLNLGAPLILKILIQHLGWYALFATLGALNAVALVANIFGMPDSP